MKMKIGFYSAVVGAIFLASCGSEPKSEDQKVTVPTEQTDDTEVREVDEFVLPSTVQIGDLFRNSGLEYIGGLTLDPQKVSNYNTTYDKYFVFGAYWTDMTYCVLNNQSQEARKYMKVIKNLSTDLGAGEVFENKELLDRFDKSLEKNDSILSILIEIDERTDAYVEDNGQEEFALVAFVGGWVEGMYLGVSTVSMTDHSELTGRIIEQMVILDKLIEGLVPLKGSSKRLDAVLLEMNSLYDFYINIPVIANLEGSITEVEIPSTDMKLLGDKILKLRNLIVE
jgi:hypothetical protein